MRHLQRLLDTLGAAGVLGLGVLVFCAAFYVTAIAPAEREREAQRSAAERLKSRSPYQMVSTSLGSTEVSRFQSLFPPLERLPDELENVYALARNARLATQQGEYRLEARGAGLAAYRVTLPIRGSYAQIREFVGNVLKEMPIASVDALRFERKKVGDTVLEAQVQLSIYLRSTSEGGLK